MSPNSCDIISGSTRFRPARRLPGRRLAAETVVVDPQNRKVFSLNAVAGAVWAAVERGATEAEIVDEIVARFRVDGARARSDVDGFLLQLETLGLAVRAEPQP